MRVKIGERVMANKSENKTKEEHRAELATEFIKAYPDFILPSSPMWMQIFIDEIVTLRMKVEELEK
jgi:hypothetical protein